MNTAEYLAKQMRDAESGAISTFSSAFADVGAGALAPQETIVVHSEDAARADAHSSAFSFLPPGCVVFVGSLGQRQDGNGWWSKLAMMKGYAQLGFHIAEWTRTDKGDPLGQLTRVDPLGEDPLRPTKLGEMDLYSAIPHVALVVDRYSPNYSQPEILRLVFGDDERNFHPRIVADFADVTAWVNTAEGRDYRSGERAYYSPSISAAWRPELLKQYDVVHLPKGPAAARVRKVLEAA